MGSDFISFANVLLVSGALVSELEGDLQSLQYIGYSVFVFVAVIFVLE